MGRGSQVNKSSRLWQFWEEEIFRMQALNLLLLLFGGFDTGRSLDITKLPGMESMNKLMKGGMDALPGMKEGMDAAANAANGDYSNGASANANAGNANANANGNALAVADGNGGDAVANADGNGGNAVANADGNGGVAVANADGNGGDAVANVKSNPGEVATLDVTGN